MRNLFITILLFSVSIAFGQNKPEKNHSLMINLTCKTCHSCDVPTKKDPCLKPCPRADMISINETPAEAPDVEVLKELSKKYMPVVFAHRIHAQMSEMSGGCAICHHYNTIGPIQPCKNCHVASRIRQDISKPDLEAAYHQQCINCHREWSHSENCTSCHALKNSAASEEVSKGIKNITGKTHPKLQVPVKLVFETNNSKGRIVTFYHEEHIKKFGATCVDCHKQNNCTTCHDKNKATLVNNSGSMPIKLQKSKAEHHKPCFSCHQDSKCSLCHKNSESGPFNHQEVTGWKLNKFHKNLPCEKCHGTPPKFVKLNNECTACHNNFVPGKFNHAVTGLKLDENHSDLDCDNCHQEKNFENPGCTNCHEHKSFPKDKPGKLVPINVELKVNSSKK